MRIPGLRLYPTRSISLTRSTNTQISVTSQLVDVYIAYANLLYIFKVPLQPAICIWQYL